MNLWVYLWHQRSWSREAFGPGKRTKGIIEHIKKELVEIEQDPTDVEEWCDVVILALDGAWRSGADFDTICKTLQAKRLKNSRREWPDWRLTDEDHAIEHVRGKHD